MTARRLLLACALGVAACVSSVAADFAIVKLDGSGEALLISAVPIAAGSTVALQTPDANQRPRCCKQLRAEGLVAVDAAEVLASDEIQGATPRVYRAKVPKEWADMPFIGLAAAGTKLRAQGREDRLELTEASGTKRIASLCTSAEGVHLQESVQGRRRTHLYLSLGYEIESPTCR